MDVDRDIKKTLKFRDKRNWISRKILYLIISVLLLLNIYQYFRDPLKTDVLIEVENPFSGYVFKGSLNCVVQNSSDRESLGEELFLIDLETDSPRLLVNDGGTFPLSVMYDKGNTLVLGLIASGSGGTDIVVLDKSTGQFARTSSGNLAGVYAYSHKGFCK